MRYLILSDIHANRQALEAVLTDARGAYQEILCCGDLVGYGADPNYVVEWARTALAAVIRGNHDRACAFFDDALEWFSPVARASALWTRKQLTAENADWLRGLPAGPRAINASEPLQFELIHSSPRDEDEYVISMADFRATFPCLMSRLAFFGHTHLQCACSWFGGRYRLHASGSVLDVRGDAAWLINPGAVGQPRDEDPRAGYALYDTESGEIQLKRVDYDVETARRAIFSAGLPRRLGNRLLVGS